MSMVQMGKKWEITTIEEYNKAMEILDGNEFIARMSDDYGMEKRECAEIDRQRADIEKQAKEKRII